MIIARTRRTTRNSRIRQTTATARILLLRTTRRTILRTAPAAMRRTARRITTKSQFPRPAGVKAVQQKLLCRFLVQEGKRNIVASGLKEARQVRKTVPLLDFICQRSGRLPGYISYSNSAPFHIEGKGFLPGTGCRILWRYNFRRAGNFPDFVSAVRSF